MCKPLALLFLSACLTASLHAGEKHQHSHHSHKAHAHEAHGQEEKTPTGHAHADDARHSSGHGAHVHGQAELTIAAEQNTLELVFESPGMNLVGFEHAPVDAQQRARIREVQALLKEPTNVVLIEGGQCTLAHAQSESSYPLDAAAEPSKQPANTEEHHGFKAQYQFHCAALAQVRSMQLPLLAQFPSIEHLQVQWVMESRQGMQSLNAKKPQLSFD